MADRRRRRRIKSSEDSEELSEGSVEEQEVEKASEAESIDETKEAKDAVADSEYESAEEEGEGEKNKTVDESFVSTSGNVIEEIIEQAEIHNGEVKEVKEAETVEEDDVVEDTVIEGEYVDGEEDDDEEDELDDDEEDGEDEVLEDGEWKDEERQQGDGQESQVLKEKVLDDDEDKRNPQYIPKKGGFYEHDDRLFDNEEKEEEKKPKKKLWKDEGKWSHDRFKEEDQRPKSRDELVTIYGYDIRNEDGPPRARRRRRYGRGPNKYTRKWEDEEAYAKLASTRRRAGNDVIRGRGGRGRGPRGRGFGPRGGGRGRGMGRGNEFVRLPPWQRYQDGRPRSHSFDESKQSGNDESRTNVAFSTNSKRVDPEMPVPISPSPTVTSTAEVATSSMNGTQSSHTDSDGSSDQPDEIISETPLVVTNKNIKPFTNNGLSFNAKENLLTEKQTQTELKPRGGGTRGGGRNLVHRGIGDRRTFQSRFKKDSPRYNTKDGSGDPGNIMKGMEKLSLKDSKDGRPTREPRKEAKVAPTQHHAPQERWQQTVPPRLQEGGAASANRPKRYSSQRQRNVPESSSFQASPPLQSQGQIPPGFYEHGIEYPQVAETRTAPPPPPQQQGGATPLLPPPPHSFQGYTPPYQETYTMRPMASPPRIFAPVTMATGTIATGQPVMPAPYISPNNNMMNYGPPPANYTQYTFQQYPSPPPPQPVVGNDPTPQEIFRGGMAYYNTHNQSIPMRMHVKRPKAAIPIVPPPDLEDSKKDDQDSLVLTEEDDISLDESPVVGSHVAVEG